MSDQLAARIRTVWPMLLGHIVTYLGAQVLRYTGIQVDSLLLLEIVSVAVSVGVWDVGTWLEKRANPVLQSVGRWLVSMGKNIGAPTYGDKAQ